MNGYLSIILILQFFMNEMISKLFSTISYGCREINGCPHANKYYPIHFYNHHNDTHVCSLQYSEKTSHITKFCKALYIINFFFTSEYMTGNKLQRLWMNDVLNKTANSGDWSIYTNSNNHSFRLCNVYGASQVYMQYSCKKSR